MKINEVNTSMMARTGLNIYFKKVIDLKKFIRNNEIVLPKQDEMQVKDAVINMINDISAANTGRNVRTIEEVVNAMDATVQAKNDTIRELELAATYYDTISKTYMNRNKRLALDNLFIPTLYCMAAPTTDELKVRFDVQDDGSSNNDYNHFSDMLTRYKTRIEGLACNVIRNKTASTVYFRKVKTLRNDMERFIMSHYIPDFDFDKEFPLTQHKLLYKSGSAYYLSGSSRVIFGCLSWDIHFEEVTVKDIQTELVSLGLKKDINLGCLQMVIIKGLGIKLNARIGNKHGPRRIDVLLQNTDGSDRNVIINIHDLPKLAKELGIKIVCYNEEGHRWDKNFSKIPKYNSSEAHYLVKIAVRDHHARLLKPGTNKSILHYTIHTSTAVKSIKTNIFEKFLDPWSSDAEVEPVSTTKYVDLADKQCHIPYVMEFVSSAPNHDIVLYNCSKIHSCFSLVAAQNAVQFDVIGDLSGDDTKPSIVQIVLHAKTSCCYIRHMDIHALTDLVIPQYNLTIGSSVMSMFKRSLKEPQLKLTSPYIAQIMKSACTPKVFINRGTYACNKDELILALDINGAYCYTAGQVLHGFTTQPVQTILDDYTKPGFYYNKSNNKWVLDFMIGCNSMDASGIKFPTNAILFDCENTILRDFLTVFMELGYIPNKIRKNGYCTLVGKLQPNIESTKRSIVHQSIVDFSRFIIESDDKIFHKVTQDEKNFITHFSYFGDSHYNKTNLTYLSAQVIQRCIKCTTDAWNLLKERDPNAILLGQMHDCIIVKIKKGTKVSDLIGKDIGMFKVEAKGHKFVGAGIGQYYIEGEIPKLRHQGYSKEKNLAKSAFASYMMSVIDLCIKMDKRLVPEYDLPNIRSNITIVQGSAGRGKTHYITEHYPSEIFLAPTNVAASELINGKTLYSFFGLGEDDSRSVPDCLEAMCRYTKDSRIDYRKNATVNRIRFREASIVIDEVWTASKNVIDKVDKILRLLTGFDTSFGGVHVVLCGDRYQLHSPGGSCEPLIDAMVSEETIVLPHTKNSRCTRLYEKFFQAIKDMTTKAQVIRHIKKHLDKFAKSPIENARWECYRNVMVSKYNKNAGGLYNGCTGLVTYKNGKPKKKLPKGKIVNVIEVIGTMVNVAFTRLIKGVDVMGATSNTATEETMSLSIDNIKPAHAITVHKAQGATYSNVNIDIKDINCTKKLLEFKKLVYVAFSRVRDFKNCYVHL